jgi:hypothetical protein
MAADEGWTYSDPNPSNTSAPQLPLGPQRADVRASHVVTHVLAAYSFTLRAELPGKPWEGIWTLLG